MSCTFILCDFLGNMDYIEYQLASQSKNQSLAVKDTGCPQCGVTSSARLHGVKCWQSISLDHALSSPGSSMLPPDRPDNKSDNNGRHNCTAVDERILPCSHVLHCTLGAPSPLPHWGELRPPAEWVPVSGTFIDSFSPARSQPCVLLAFS